MEHNLASRRSHPAWVRGGMAVCSLACAGLACCWMAFLYVWAFRGIGGGGGDVTQLIFLGWLALPPALAAIGLGLASIVEGRSRPPGGWSRVRIAGGAAGVTAGAVAMGAVILPWAVLCLFMLLLATRPGGLWPGGW